MKKIIIAVLGMTLLVSCEDFLSKLPDNRTALESPEAIAELLVSAYPEGAYQGFTETMSDNVGDKGKGGSRYVVDYQPNEYAYFWKDDPTDDYDSPTAYWNECYTAIAASNQALSAIDKKGNRPEYSAVKGEALATRAYSHFMLTNIFGKHYNPATSANDLAVPFVDEPEEVVIKNYTRTTVGDVYKRVEADLLQAEGLIADENYTVPKYHFTQDAINAFFSRFYLYKADWEKVVSYSSKVLGSDPVAKMRDWNGKYASLDLSELRAQYTRSEEPVNILLAKGYSVWAQGVIVFRYALSPTKKEEVFSQTTNPFELVIGDKVALAASDALLAFIPKFLDRIEKSGGGSSGLPNTILPLFTTSEVLFNRAEAYVMLGQYDNALADINTYLKKTAKSYKELKEDDLKAIYSSKKGPELSPFYPLNERQTKFLWFILDLRRKDFIQEGLRWFDIKRFDIEVEHDIFGGTSIKLPKGDLRRVVQIPGEAISRGLVPNPR